MELKIRCLSSLIPFFFCIFSSVFASSPTYLSDSIFGSGASIGRNLLQAKKACPVNFEFLNYTIITSKCKGPTYPTELCCGALKEFGCPYADDLNDLSNDCASTMFSYINLYGKYPPGLFSSECKEGKLGLACDSQSDSSSSRRMILNTKTLVVLTTCFFVLLLSLF